MIGGERFCVVLYDIPIVLVMSRDMNSALDDLLEFLFVICGFAMVVSEQAHEKGMFQCVK